MSWLSALAKGGAKPVIRSIEDMIAHDLVVRAPRPRTKPKTRILAEDLFPGYAAQHREKQLRKWAKGSKVVDAAGRPKVVYHGTTADIDKFRAQGIGKASVLGMTFDVPRSGIFFAEDPALASDFTLRQGRQADGGNVIPSYLSIRKPFDMRENELDRLLDSEDGRDFEKRTGLSLRGLYNQRAMDRWENFDGEEGADFVARLKDAGYDGAVMHEYMGDSGAVNDTSWVAFDPWQVKSIFNRGSFDRNSPYLGKARGGLVELSEKYVR